MDKIGTNVIGKLIFREHCKMMALAYTMTHRKGKIRDILNEHTDRRIQMKGDVTP